MARCSDFPCCGHEPGCCPDFDESGKQLNMVCVCGKKLPITSRYSICDACMNAASDDPFDYGDYYNEQIQDDIDAEIDAHNEEVNSREFDRQWDSEWNEDPELPS